MRKPWWQKRADVHTVWSHLSIFLALVFLGRAKLGIVPRVCNTFQIFFRTTEKQHDENVTRVFCCSLFLAAIKNKKSVEFGNAGGRQWRSNLGNVSCLSRTRTDLTDVESFLSALTRGGFFQGQVVSSPDSCLRAVASWQLPAALLWLVVSSHCLKKWISLSTGTFLPRLTPFP